MRCLSAPAAALAALVFLVPRAFADTLVLDFRDHAPVTMSEPWVEQGLELVVAPIGGLTSYVVVSRYGLSMAQAVLSVDLRPLEDVRAVDVQAVTTSGLTTVSLHDGDRAIDTVINDVQLRVEILTVEAGDGTAFYVQAGGTNVRVISIAIRHGSSPVEPSSWGGVKALFR